MKKFFNPNTQYDPEYRNVQSELWQLLTEDQQKVVASVFCHLKNHAQIEIAEAMIDYIEADIHPQATDWSDVNIGSMFYMLVFRLFGKDLTDGFVSKPVSEGFKVSKGFKSFLNRFSK